MIFNFKGTSDAKTLGGHSADEFAKSEHKHSKVEITDFPEAMPASDVKAWAKADTKPAYTAAEVGALSNSGGDINGALQIFSHLYVRKSDESPIQLNLINPKRSLYHEIDANGNYVFYDRTNGDRIIHSTADGTNTFNGKATGNGNPVHIGTAAPSDTSALWVDISA